MDQLLKYIGCYLLDMDGTFYLSDRLLPGAKNFLSWLDTHSVPYLFLTNNSSKSNQQYVQKLRSLGLTISSEKVFTSGQATSIFLIENFPMKSVFLLGTDELKKEFLTAGIQINEIDPDVVVLGFDTTLTYQKLSSCCRFIQAGKPYLATHSDINCPTSDGFIPDAGAMIELIRSSTGRSPDIVIGKPNRPIVNAIENITGIPLELTAMVGDRLYTDMAMKQHGIKTILVLSGETKSDQVETSPYVPDLIVENIAELYKLLIET